MAGRDKKLPVMMNYETILNKDSLYNTPPVFAIYIVGKVAKWLKKQGGLAAMEAVNRKKAALLYALLDKYPEFYKGRAEKASRSIMNVTRQTARAGRIERAPQRRRYPGFHLQRYAAGRL